MMTAEGGLMENPWSWTYVANLVALEAPVGVGYSYCEAQTRGKRCKNTDKFTASASRAALQDFFRKFPELAASDFFITGESYAGVYLPTLAKEILDHAPEIRLQGLAVGDPCTDNTAQSDSMDALWYGGFLRKLAMFWPIILLYSHCQFGLYSLTCSYMHSGTGTSTASSTTRSMICFGTIAGHGPPICSRWAACTGLQDTGTST
jgi:hypothetical protein